MAAPTLDAKQKQKALSSHKKQQKPSLRSVLCTPFKTEWPKLDTKFEQKLYAKLTAVLSEYDLKKPVVNKHLKKAERKTSIKASLETKSQVEKNLRSQLVCGVNATTKAVERDMLCLVLVDRAASTLTRHLIQLCAVRQCTAVALRDLAKTVAPLLSLTQLSCMGFRTVGPEDDKSFCEFVDMVKREAPKVELPWLSFEKAIAEDIYASSEGENEEGDQNTGKLIVADSIKSDLSYDKHFVYNKTSVIDEIKEKIISVGKYEILDPSTQTTNNVDNISYKFDSMETLKDIENENEILAKNEIFAKNIKNLCKSEKSDGLGSDFISLGVDSESSESELNEGQTLKTSSKKSANKRVDSGVKWTEPLGSESVSNKKRKGDSKDKIKEKKKRKLQSVERVDYQTASLHKQQPNPNKKKKKKKQSQGVKSK